MSRTERHSPEDYPTHLFNYVSISEEIRKLRQEMKLIREDSRVSSLVKVFELLRLFNVCEKLEEKLLEEGDRCIRAMLWGLKLGQLMPPAGTMQLGKCKYQVKDAPASNLSYRSQTWGWTPTRGGGSSAILGPGVMTLINRGSNAGRQG
jgi:hypothetical protein